MSDLALNQTSGGTLKTAVAAGTTAADSVISAYPGRVNRLVVTTAASDTLELYDHATASSGAKLIWKSATNTAVGDVHVLDLPVANGIVALKANGSAACTVSYTQDKNSDAVCDRSQLITNGGQGTSYHAAGSSGASAALSGPGRLCKVSVLSSGSAETIFYDNSAASGTKIYTLKANPTIGTVIDLQLPVSTGIYVAGATNTSALLVTYSTDSVRNR